MVTEVQRALDAAAGPDADRDAGTVELALAYAREIDADPDALLKMGPALLATLTALLLTPGARAAALRNGKQVAVPGRDPLDELRRRRAERAAGAG